MERDLVSNEKLDYGFERRCTYPTERMDKACTLLLRDAVRHAAKQSTLDFIALFEAYGASTEALRTPILSIIVDVSNGEIALVPTLESVIEQVPRIVDDLYSQISRYSIVLCNIAVSERAISISAVGRRNLSEHFELSSTETEQNCNDFNSSRCGEMKDSDVDFQFCPPAFDSTFIGHSMARIKSVLTEDAKRVKDVLSSSQCLLKYTTMCIDDVWNIFHEYSHSVFNIVSAAS